MSNILITGATGNIGLKVIQYLFDKSHKHIIYAGVRNFEKAKTLISNKDLRYRKFDFCESRSFDSALENIDTLFLLRPPELADIDEYFVPLVKACVKNNVNKIVFLSVQGAEKSKIIPHNKIEKLIKETGIEYIFLRPSYFMQNLTTTLFLDIQNRQQIILPAGKAVFNWIDVNNIGEIAAYLLTNFDVHKNKAIELTGSENKNFYYVQECFKSTLHKNITYKAVSPLKFYRIKKKEGVLTGMILVMIMLHFLPRFQKPPVISNFYEEITGKLPTKLHEFLQREF